MKADYTECKKGVHKFKEIQRKSVDQDTYSVVKWCPECGAIVVDMEYDNRVNPGYYKKLEYPNIAHDHVKEIMS